MSTIRVLNKTSFSIGLALLAFSARADQRSDIETAMRSILPPEAVCEKQAFYSACEMSGFFARYYLSDGALLLEIRMLPQFKTQARNILETLGFSSTLLTECMEAPAEGVGFAKAEKNLILTCTANRIVVHRNDRS